MKICEKLPDKILIWKLKGRGLENFGNSGQPDTIPFPEYSEDDLIAKVDAVGICFSDVKLIKAGDEHPRIKNRDLKKNPVTPGHEVSLTIVGVGDKRKDSFKCGERYIVQADVYYKGKSVAFGYVLPGAFSEYVILGREIIDGDEGCYLIPVQVNTGYAEAALVEPWSCVVAAYQTKRRTEPEEKGIILFTGSKENQIDLDLSGLENRSFKTIYHKNLTESNRSRLESLAGKDGYILKEIQDTDSLSGMDDIVYSGIPGTEEFKRLIGLMQPGGIISIHAAKQDTGLIPVDIGKAHYRNIRIVGSGTGKVVQSYRANTRTDLKPEGTAWFIGGAGPMGQMHVIRAAMTDNRPGKILVTDLSSRRLKSLKNRIDQVIINDRLEIIYLNTAELTKQEFNAFLSKEFPQKFDDIISLVPVSSVIEQAVPFSANEGVVNIFAGVNIGTFASFPLEVFTEKHVNVIGSSGSPLSAMKDTLNLVQADRLSTNISLSAVTDMHSVSAGVKALTEGTYTGKVVVYPHARDLGIHSTEELAKRIPDLEILFLNGKYWTNEAEKRFLSSRFFEDSKK
ncbi:MAG: alcohol dehydrogenase catalytic domain-containing protein [Spirochaetes bacterium]|nr:alcohol dehydrogenase catalytic domain-containing protein [Spirochaetota bacterium]